MPKRLNIELGDGINVLPDELLVCILSFLSLKEAAATSIFCRRWRYLWNFTNKLDFDGLDFFWRIWLRTERPKYSHENFLKFMAEIWSEPKTFEESWNYIAWVNNILEFHKCCRIDEFRVDFFLSEPHKKHIDNWLKCASDKKVQRLELNLRWKPFGDSKGYTFPRITFKHLQTMRMQWVDISSEGLEFLLGTCPLLEELSVSYSKSLTTLMIISSSLPLKRLEINHCIHLNSVEIRDVRLVFFMYHGGRLQQFAIKNVPHLVEMYLGGKILKCMKDFLLMFSSYLPQLEKLTINEVCSKFLEKEVAKMFYNNVKMRNLKQLVFKYCGHCNLLSVTYFIGASPALQSFVLEAYGEEDESLFYNENMESYLYPSLEQVELIGYRGTSIEQDLIGHILENGVALEEFIIDLRKRDNAQFYYTYFWPNIVNGVLPLGYDCTQEDQINAAKDRARDQFAKKFKTCVLYRLARRLTSTVKHLHLKIL